MWLSAYFIVADERTASLLIMIDEVALTSGTNAVAFEKGFEYTSPFEKGHVDDV